jgi:hypothetical protein
LYTRHCAPAPRDPTREVPTARTSSSDCYFRGLVAEGTLTCQRTVAPALILSRSHCPAGATSVSSVTAIGICLLTAREEIIGATLESRNVAVGFFVADERHQHPGGAADDRSPQHAPGNHRPRTLDSDTHTQTGVYGRPGYQNDGLMPVTITSQS